MRDKLIELLRSNRVVLETAGKSATSLLRLADHLITNDVVPVVRCKDCKKCTTINNAGEPLLFCEHWKGYPKVEQDGFCYWGERKDDGT